MIGKAVARRAAGFNTRVRLLIRALRTKQIAGAGLDVFEYEPKVGKELRKLNNVVLTPHVRGPRLGDVYSSLLNVVLHANPHINR